MIMKQIMILKITTMLEKDQLLLQFSCKETTEIGLKLPGSSQLPFYKQVL